jgi:hypothetical protein
MASIRLLEDGSFRLLQATADDLLLEGDGVPAPVAPTSSCITSLQLCAMRLAVLDPEGRPTVPGTNRGYVTTSAIKLQVGVTIKEGADLQQLNARGEVCGTFKQPDTIKRLDLSMDLCQWDAQLVALLVTGGVVSSGGNAVGFTFPNTTGPDPFPVCLEAWSKAWSGTQQASPPFTSPLPAYIHWVFPYVQFTINQFSIENALQVVNVTGPCTVNTLLTANGPYDDWPAAVRNVGGIAGACGWFFDSVLPTATCDYITTTSAAS